MYQATRSIRQFDYVASVQEHAEHRTSGVVSCNWQMLRDQLLAQWRLVTARELDMAGPNRYRIANLIERKYGIAAGLVENYLRNFERTMPLYS